MNLQEFLEKVGGKESDIKMFEFSEENILAAVQQNGDALQYVAESRQTEGIVLAAVQQDGYALRYVNKKVFSVETTQK